MTEVGADKLSAKTSNVIQSLLSQDVDGVDIAWQFFVLHSLSYYCFITFLDPNPFWAEDILDEALGRGIKTAKSNELKEKREKEVDGREAARLTW